MLAMRAWRTLVVAAFLGAGLFFLRLSPAPAKAAQRVADEYLVYFGTYTRTAGKGIYAYRFRPGTGGLTPLGLAAETPHPSFVAVHPNGRFLYATNEHEGDDSPGVPNTVSAFAIDQSTGKLTLLNKVSAGGEGPCHLSVDKTGAILLVANFRNGSVAALPIQKDGHVAEATAVVQHQGSSVHPVRQRGPHAHFIAPSADNRFALVVDLGLDRVITYQLNPTKGTLTSAGASPTPPGSQPRHLAFHPSNRYVYVNGEATSTVSTFAYDIRTGMMKLLQTVSTLPADFSGESTTAEIQVDAAGRFLYVSNRGLDTIAVLKINQKDGQLSLVEQAPTQGKTPRFFTFDPSGKYVLAGNQNSNTVIVYRVDATTGHLTPTRTLTDVPEPACIVFVPVRP
jgi:6-phosphogluconolactonase